jgi:putative ABC transport system permease protein
VLARCHRPEQARAVVERINKDCENVRAFTKEDFSYRSRMHWLAKTKGGIVLGQFLLIILSFCAVLTSQQAYTTGRRLHERNPRRLEVLPRGLLMRRVLAPVLAAGMVGSLLPLPATLLLAGMLDDLVVVRWQMQVTVTLLTLMMALVAGLVAAHRLWRFIRAKSLLS